MSFNPNLNYGDEMDNKQLSQIFKCSNAGGMRRSKRTNTLVLISDHTKSFYNDRWVGDEMYYTGMGLTGDQSLDYMQNRTLNQSNENSVDIHLFEVNKPRVYTYLGRVALKREPFQENQIDTNKNKRKVWIFPLKLLDYPDGPLISEEEFKRDQEEREKKVRELSKEDIENRARQSSGKPKSRNVVSKVYGRNPHVAEFTKMSANGICQLCNSGAPFESKDGNPYLEVHHIEWLSKGGKDIIENTTALCPNCHKKMHILNLLEDRNYLKKYINNL